MLELAGYDSQVLRSQLDERIYDAAHQLFHFNDAGKGIDHRVSDPTKTTFRFYAKGGYAYEVTTRVIAYPGMEGD